MYFMYLESPLYVFDLVFITFFFFNLALLFLYLFLIINVFVIRSVEGSVIPFV